MLVVQVGRSAAHPDSNQTDLVLLAHLLGLILIPLCHRIDLELCLHTVLGLPIEQVELKGLAGDGVVL